MKEEKEKDLPCPHGRSSWQNCPHCLGLNTIEELPTLEINVIDSVINKDLGPGQKK